MSNDNGKQPKRKAKSPHSVQGGSTQANRIAIMILEVLAGQRTPGNAAQTLGVTVPRYYQLETRAVNGLVAACEPRAKGKRASLKTRVSALERELARAQQEAARQQSLVRAAHRSLGLKAAPLPDKQPEKKSPGRRRRKPVVRALRAAKTLEHTSGNATVDEVQPSALKANVKDSSGEA
jgi:hypothetical protein